MPDPVTLDKSTLTPIQAVTLDKSTLAPIGGQDTGVLAALKRTGANLAHAPGAIYDALAAQHGGSAAVDYDALAAQHGGRAAETAAPPGAFRRFLQNFGVPTSEDEIGSALKTHVLNLATAGMYGALNSTTGALEGYAKGGNELLHAKSPTDVAHATIDASKPFPVIGSFAQGGEDALAGNYRGAAGDVTAGAVQAALPELAKRVPAAKVGATADALAQPAIGMGIEALKDVPIVRGLIKGAKAYKDLPDQLRNIWDVSSTLEKVGQSLPDNATADSHPATHQAVMDALDTLDQASGENIPHTPSGDVVMNQALTALDKPTLMRIAKARGINTTAEANLIDSKAEASLVKKIGADLSPDELDEARELGLELSRNKPVSNPDTTQAAGQEAWHYKVIKQFFPDVALPKAMETRAQATIANRPNPQVYSTAAKQSLPANTPEPQVKAKAAELQGQDEDLADMLQKSIAAVQAKKGGGGSGAPPSSSAPPAGGEPVSGPQGGHAGGGSISEEEAQRPGRNFVINKAGTNVTNQLQSFDPGSTPAGGVHVTVRQGMQPKPGEYSLGNGYVYKINAGQSLSPAQGLALKKALFEARKQ